MKQHIYVIGDIHGSWQPVCNFVQRAPYLFRQKGVDNENITGKRTFLINYEQ